MLQILRASTGFVRPSALAELPTDAVWIDLLNPTPEESAFVEAQKKVRIPSIEALGEIESSSRLAVDHDVIYLSIPAVAQGDTPDAHLSPTGFILAEKLPHHRSFCAAFHVRCRCRTGKAGQGASKRDGDICRVAGSDGGSGSRRARAPRCRDRQSFENPFSVAILHDRGNIVRSNNTLRRALTAVGTTGDRLALARDALLGVGRVAPFVLSLQKSMDHAGDTGETRGGEQRHPFAERVRR